MKSSRKKGLITGLLALVLVLALMATSAFAAEHNVNLGSIDTDATGVEVTSGAETLNQSNVSGAITDIVLKAADGKRALGKTQEGALNEALSGTGLKATLDSSTGEITISGRPNQNIDSTGSDSTAANINLGSLIATRGTNEYKVLVWSDDESEADEIGRAHV